LSDVLVELVTFLVGLPPFLVDVFLALSGLLELVTFLVDVVLSGLLELTTFLVELTTFLVDLGGIFLGFTGFVFLGVCILLYIIFNKIFNKIFN
tara:strand:+ start:61 stop:342 length:282 start_codon:yes stop_codon:yes gene_type:complete